MARPGLDADLRIGRTIKDARLRRGLRQSEVALAMGVSIRTYRGYESGEGRVPLDRRPWLAMALGLVLDDFKPRRPPQGERLTPQERRHLAGLRRLPPSEREALFALVPSPQPAQERASC